jgi:hypothetical protein
LNFAECVEIQSHLIFLVKYSNLTLFLFRFDLAVNGGGAVTLQFQRSPLKAATRTTQLPWNGIIVINPVVMTAAAGGSLEEDGNGEEEILLLEEDSPAMVRKKERGFVFIRRYLIFYTDLAE